MNLAEALELVEEYKPLTPEETLAYAKRVAWSMSKDPEVESIAGMGAFRALRTYNGRIRFKRWVARCVKTSVWCYWRKRANRHEELKDVAWCCEVYETPPVPCAEECVSTEDWQMLWEKHVEKWCIDVVARRHSMTIHECKKRLKAAESRFLKVHGET